MRGAPPSIWTCRHRQVLATYPPGKGGPPFARSLAGTDLPAYLVLQPMGFTKLPMSPPALVSSYLTFSSLPPHCCGSAVSLSAALSVAGPFLVRPLPVRKHGALCCPDFPLRTPCGPRNGGAMHRISRNDRPPLQWGGREMRSQWWSSSTAVAPWPYRRGSASSKRRCS